MATSQDYLKIAEGMGPAPTPYSLKQQVADVYKGPILQPLVNETANLNAQFLPALFEPFTRMGTGAADMSPAARLALIGGSLNRVQSRVDANNQIGNFYGAQMGEVAQGVGQNWQNQNQNAWKLYEAKKQEEQFNQQLALSRQKANPVPAPAFPGGNPSSTGLTGDGGTTARVAIKDGVDQLNSGNTNYSSPAWQNIFARLKQAGFTDPLSQIDFRNFNFNTMNNSPVAASSAPTSGITPLNGSSWLSSPGLKLM